MFDSSDDVLFPDAICKVLGMNTISSSKQDRGKKVIDCLTYENLENIDLNFLF